MIKHKHYYFLFWLSILFIAWMIQAKLFLNWDVSGLLNSTRLMLAGGSYTHDFFTANPPMILYLYIPPIIMNKISGISLILTFRTYIFILAVFSFLICFFLARSIFKTEDNILHKLFLGVILFTFLILPMQHLGQRDHLLVLLTMPYLLLVVCRLQNIPIPVFYAITIGIMAGLGFGIKPHFLLTPLLLEIYYIHSTKRWFAFLRPETCAILCILVLYFSSVLIFFPDFLTVIIPYSTKYYYSNIALSWFDLSLNSIMVFCSLAIILFCLEFKTSSHKNLATILCLALIGFLFSYLSQRTEFYYHLIPPFSLAILLLSLLLISSIKKHLHYFNIIITILILSFPIYTIIILYQDGKSYKSDIINSLITFISTQPKNSSVYFFTQSNYGSPLRDYIPIINNQRFDCLWMIGNLIQKRKQYGDVALRQYIKNTKEKYFFLNLITDDLHKYKPDLILVDTRDINTWLGGNISHFDYIDYFSENRYFKNEWKSYRYLTTITGGHMRYKLQVYARR